MQPEMNSTQIRLELAGVPSEYVPEDLSQRANELLTALEDLLQISKALSCTRLTYRLSHEVDRATGAVKHLALLHLAPRNATQLDLFAGGIQREQAEDGIAHDAKTLIELMKSAPQRCDRAHMQFASRVAAAVMDFPPEDLPTLRADALALLRKPARRILGRLCGSPWQLPLEHVGVDWECAKTHLYARVYRERDGFSLRAVKRSPQGTATARLRMSFPGHLDTVLALDRASHTGKPVTMTVRLGRDPGDEQPWCADFISFQDDIGHSPAL